MSNPDDTMATPIPVPPPPPPPQISRTAMVMGTAGGGVAIAELTPTVDWALNGFPRGARPDSTAGIVASALLFLAAIAYHVIVSKYGSKLGLPPANPPQAGL